MDQRNREHLMGYKARNQKTVDLPSGAKAAIRKLNGYDFTSLGSLPVPSLNDRESTRPEKTGAQAEAELKQGVELAKIALTRCVEFLEYEGEKLIIVDKSAREVTEDEISIEQLDQADADALVTEIMDFSGFGKKEAQRFAPFPSQPTHADQSACSGQELPSAAHGVA